MLTLRQAANYLNVSHEYVVRRINDKTFPYIRRGTGIFISGEFLKAHKKQVKKRAEEAMDFLVAQAQELGLGY